MKNKVSFLTQLGLWYYTMLTSSRFEIRRDDPTCLALVSAYEVHMLELFQQLCPQQGQTLQLRQVLLYLETKNLAKSSDELNGQMVELYFKSMNSEKSMLDTNRTNIDSELTFPEFTEVLLRYAEQATGVHDSKFFEVSVCICVTMKYEQSQHQGEDSNVYTHSPEYFF